MPISDRLLHQKPYPTPAILLRLKSTAGDELKSFRSCLRWICVDHSTSCNSALSWIIFFSLTVFVPSISHFFLSFSARRRPYDAALQLSLSSAATLAFFFLCSARRSYGLRRLLFLDELRRVSPIVHSGYTHQLGRSFRILFLLVAPCFVAEFSYKIWWYLCGARRIRFLGNPMASDAVAFVLEMASWIYRTAIFLLVCVLFRLICQLQILRLQDFAAVFREESEVEAVLRQHLGIRKHLRVISHRFRFFIVVCLVIVTASQLTALFLATRRDAEFRLFDTGELALCSITLVTGLLICLRSAAKITHKAQALTAHAAKWHVCSTVAPDPESLATVQDDDADVDADSDGDGEFYEAEAESEDELEGTMLLQPQPNTISFQKRQALVSYFENNKAGITIFGSVLDRAWLHTVGMLELTLFLWLLSKTIGNWDFLNSNFNF